jgi:putative spermidine/putrescine transport system substrate-binding protein
LAVDDYWVARNTYATVLAYSTKAFPDRHPTTWAEFWDVKTFPGPRMLQDPSFGAVDLEQALLADGVPMDKLYPIDIDRAFRKFEEIRSYVVKWWDSGAVAAQMLAEQVAVCGSIWDSRITTLIDQGAPLNVEWNQSMLNLQATSITKGSPNRENAYRLTDYGLQPKIQAAIGEAAKTSPANRKAFDFMDPTAAAKLASFPGHTKGAFLNNAKWWFENGAEAVERFREFRLKG